MRLVLTFVVVMMMSLTYSAQAQRQRGNNDGSGDRTSNSGDGNSGERNPRDRNSGDRNSNEDRSSRWSRNGGGNYGGGNYGGNGGGNGRSRSSESRSGSGGPGFNEQYSIITERNIFMRDRRSRNDERDRGSRSGPPRTPEQTYVLTGVVIEDDEFHAYLEDVTRRTSQKFTVGAPLARGKIAAIDIDAIAYESNGHVTWVVVGSNLTGAAVGSVSDERINAALYGGGGAAQTAPTAGAPLPDANNPNLTTEEKMRLRRMMESNPGAIMPGVPQEQPDSNEQPAEGAEQFQQPQQPQNSGNFEQTAPPQPGQENSGLSLEEQMRLRRQQEQQGLGR
jgi:hypothetical protein